MAVNFRQPALFRPAMMWRGVLLCAMIAAGGCSRGHTCKEAPSPRILSHSARITRILFELQLDEHLVGVTNWCDLPDGREIPRVADAHGVRLETALSVNPQLVLTQSDPAKFDSLKRHIDGLRVERICLESIDDVFATAERIGVLLDREPHTQQIVADVKSKIEALRRPQPASPPRVLFSTGLDRPMVPGAGTYIDDLIVLLGGVNAGRDIPGNMLWKKVKIESILAVAPDVLILQVPRDTESRARRFWAGQKDLPATKSGRVFVVSGDTWLRPGMGDLVALGQEMQPMIAPAKGAAK